MNSIDQLLSDLEYLEQVGMGVAQLRALHHWSGTDAERRVTFATARRYFAKPSQLRENNSQFALRVHATAEECRRHLQSQLPGIITRVLQKHPLGKASE